MDYAVIGAAGYAQEVAWALREQQRAAGARCTIRFFDDRIPEGPVASGLGPVAGPLAAVAAYAGPDTRLVVGVGLPRVKRLVVERLAPLGLPWHTVIHPNAVIGPNVEIGEGVYVGAGAVVTLNIRIGAFASVNLRCQIGHDASVGRFTTLHPAVTLSGKVTVGDGCELGSAAVVINDLALGDDTVLGAGAVVVRSLAGRRTYVGVPAKEVSAR